QIEQSELVDVPLPVERVRVAEDGQAKAGPQRVEELAGGREKTTRHGSKAAQELVGSQRHIPFTHETLSPLAGRDQAALERVGVGTRDPALQNLVRRRRPAQILSQLARPRKIDEHAAEVEEEEFDTQCRLSTV